LLASPFNIIVKNTATPSVTNKTKYFILNIMGFDLTVIHKKTMATRIANVK
jgi:hypothetical protein